MRSAHRDPDAVAEYARSAAGRGLRVLICGAGLAAALPGVVAAQTELPVIGVPLRSSLSVMDGLDALLSIVQMPPGVPVATVGVDNAQERRRARGAHPRRLRLGRARASRDRAAVVAAPAIDSAQEPSCPVERGDSRRRRLIATASVPRRELGRRRAEEPSCLASSRAMRARR